MGNIPGLPVMLSCWYAPIPIKVLFLKELKIYRTCSISCPGVEALGDNLPPGRLPCKVLAADKVFVQ